MLLVRKIIKFNRICFCQFNLLWRVAVRSLHNSSAFGYGQDFGRIYNVTSESVRKKPNSGMAAYFINE